MGTKGDMYTKEIIERIIQEGCFDENPRPHWADGTPAHTLSVNHGMCTYDLNKNESPLITLRPITIKSPIEELLWIYQDRSNNLDSLKEKYVVNWWDELDIGNRTIDQCYGATVHRHNCMRSLLDELRNNPDGRRHQLYLWQVDDFLEENTLKPCTFLTQWNVRHGNDGVDYLDMSLTQGTIDFITAGCINQVQYLVLLCVVARHLGYTPGRFTWFYNNIQIYDRHIDAAKELLKREPIDCNPEVYINPEKTDFYSMTQDDIKIIGYPRKEIKEKNPQLKLEIAI